MKQLFVKFLSTNIMLSMIAFFLIILGLLRDALPTAFVYNALVLSGFAILFLAFLQHQSIKRKETDFANAVCETLDILMDGHMPKSEQAYEDSQISKVQGKLLQYHDRMCESARESIRDKQIIQELVSDISHQVKTPIANIQMFTNILQQHALSEEKRNEFLATMTAQIHKLDFLMQSLIKMSRLETGTFTLHIENASLYDTIAQALNGVWEVAARKDIRITVTCDPRLKVCHDTKWTAEAFGNILDNAVKYTPEGGSIHIHAYPWQFFTRIDFTDTGIGIASGQYHSVFQRFYRGEEAAAKEGIGLGLYLARVIITKQKGYISVTSEPSMGSTFSVFLLHDRT